MTKARQAPCLKASRGARINVRTRTIKELFSQGSETGPRKAMRQTAGSDLTQGISERTVALQQRARMAALSCHQGMTTLENTPYYLYISYGACQPAV